MAQCEFSHSVAQCGSILSNSLLVDGSVAGVDDCSEEGIDDDFTVRERESPLMMTVQ